MEPPDPSFADEFNVPQDAVLVFDVRRAAVSLPFQVHRLKVLVEAGLVAFSTACFEFADEVPKEAQHSRACAPSEDFFQPSSRPSKGWYCGYLLPNSAHDTRFLDANEDSEISIFPVQLTTRRIGNLARLIYTLAICYDDRYISQDLNVLAVLAYVAERVRTFVSDIQPLVYKV